ncbi:Ig-like domain-containing protein [Microbacterium cremeum]|uniref:Ig-like domain-containing protein n=1 Tax=Microbacterium cremeum TaxID=2782169 RepID=UPI001888727A|nr:Ig-like domain-containing protein [Microbacterium cremeum]
MKRSLFASAAAALALVIGTVGAVAPAAAAPPTDPWSGSAGGEVANVTTTAVGLNVADLGIATSSATASSTATPRAVSSSSNLSVAAVGLPISVSTNSVSAPPDAGPVAGGIAAAVTGLIDIGAITTLNEAHWGLDTACVTDGVLSSATTQTAGVGVLPALNGGIVSLGVSETTGQTSLVNNSGLNYGVQSVADGTVAGISILGGTVTVAVAGETTLTATATGTSAGTVDYSPATVTVTGPSGSVTLTPAAPTTTINILGVGSVTVSLNTPSVTTTATSASASVSLLTIGVRLPAAPLPAVTQATVDVLPLQASATAPAGGIDCPPPAPVITVPASGATTSATPTIAGTATPGSTVEVFIDGASIGTTTADGLGDWTIDVTTPLAEGPHTATATATVADQVSPPSAPVPFTVDATAPPAPVITIPADGDVLNDNTPDITGTAEADSTVTVYIDDVLAGTTTADGSGNWTFTAPAPLADGAHTVVATATDAAGNVSPDSNLVNFTIDTVAPEPPVITSPEDGASVGTATPTFVGTAEAGSTVDVIVDGASIGTTTADGSGDWELTAPAPLADGPHTVVATATDAAGNVSPDSNLVNFTIDTVAPAAPVITSPTEGEVLSDSTPDITGTAEPDSTVTVIIDGVDAGTTTADGSGNWIFTPAAPLADGPHVVTATATDEAGNTGPEATPVNFVIDTVAPAAPVITSPTEGEVLSDSTPDITGTAEPDSTVTVIIDGVDAGTTTADGSGNWIFTPAAPLADGPHTVVATATDAAGNVSPDSNLVNFTIDTVAPAAPVITSPTEGEVLSDSTPDITGTAEPDSTVTVIIDGVDAGTTTADGSGNWIFTPAAPLADGPHVVTATATDEAGNTGPEATPVNFVIDATAPAPPVIVSPADGSSVNTTTPTISGTAEADASVEVFVDGASIGTTTADGSGNWSIVPPVPLEEGAHTAVATATDSAGNTSDLSNVVGFTVDTTAPAAPVITSPADGSSVDTATPPISGTAEPNSTVTVIIDGVPAGTTPADGSGNWTFTPPAPLAEGPHTAVATATDAAGNVSPESNTVGFTVDLTAPAAPVITSPTEGELLSDSTPDITGTAEANSTVTVIIDGVPAGTTTADGSGNWTFTPGTPLADGPHTVTATATDEAGNTGPEATPVNFVIDATAPAAPVITSPAEGEVLGDSTPDITGTAEPNSTVTVIIDGVPAGTTTADGSGNWTFTPGAPLADGPHTVTATATDEAGNVSPPADEVSFTIDTIAPAAPVITSPTEGQLIGDSTPDITGTAEPNSTVTVIIDGVPAGTTTADGSGNWTFTPGTPLADGPHTVTATATDEAGNTGPEATPVSFIIDTTPPAAPVITSPTDGQSLTDNTPDITGTAEPNSTVTVIIDGVPAGTTTADGSGNWTFTPTTPLTNGEHTITATATDEAGNTGPQATPITVTIAVTSGGGGGGSTGGGSTGGGTGRLPATGGADPLGGLLPAGLLLLLGGLAIAAAARRRVS